MVTEFKLTSEEKDNYLIIDTFGYINNVGGQKIVDEFDSKQPANLILNLAETKIVNSIGISFLIEIIEKLNGKGGKLIFTNLDPTIEKTFTIMGLFQFAEKAATVEDAQNLV